MALSPVPTEWDAADHDFYYPKVLIDKPKAPSNLSPEHGRGWNRPGALFNKDLMAKAKAKPPAKKAKVPTKLLKFPLRESLSVAGTPKPNHLTNHFEICATTKDIWEYEILDLDSEGRSKKNIQVLFKKAMEEWPMLKDNLQYIVADNRKTIVSWKELHQDFRPEEIVTSSTSSDMTGTIWQSPSISFGRTTVTTRFSLVRKLEIDQLIGKSQSDAKFIDQDTTATERCLNLLISKSLGNNVVQVSGKKFYIRAGRHELRDKENRVSRSLEIMRGYYFCVKAGMGALLLNFNLATSAFFRPILVSEFLVDSSTFQGELARRNIVKKLLVYIDQDRKNTDLNVQKARVKQINGFSSKNIEELVFYKKKEGIDGEYIKNGDEYEYETKPTYVHEYLSDVFGQKVTPRRVAVNVGSKNNPVWYAQEHLRIIPYQIYTRPVPDHLTDSMVNQAACNPEDSQHLIEYEGLSQLGFTTTEDNKVSFPRDIPLELYPTMLRLESRRLNFPTVKYNTQTFTQSGWSLRDSEKFYHSPVKELKYFLITTGLGNFEAKAYVKEFENQVRKRLSITAVSLLNTVETAAYGMHDQASTIESKLGDAKSKGAELVLLLIPSKDRAIYRSYKELADRKFGLQTICLTIKRDNLPKTPDQPSTNAMTKYMTNIAMKVNIKKGGVNSIVDGFSVQDTLILGADVVHPGSAALESCPSIASVVGSIDPSVTRYLGSMHLQQNDKDDHEIITSFQDMVAERIRDWMTYNKDKNILKMPTKVIYFRDGVSEGQYEKVLSKEVAKIAIAWDDQLKKAKIFKKPGMKINILAVVGVKRHHTRFYPMKKEDKDTRGNNNCLPGTLVDTGITSPYYRDFYLQSHSCIKGTARSTHYFVLRDGDVGVKFNELPEFIHKLCYTYCRSTTGVSYATPTYYADRLCERGRLYLYKTLNGAQAEELDIDKEKEIDRQRKNRNLTFRQNPDTNYNKSRDGQKSGAEVNQEQEDLATLDAFVKKRAMEYAEAEFFEHAINLDGQPRTNGNPWTDEVGKRMFWM